jgi:hypothetical protein
MQDLLTEKGLPHFVMMKRPLNTGLHIWYQKSMDSSQFITTFSFKHKDPKNPHYGGTKEQAEDQDCQIVGHAETNLEIWCKREAIVSFSYLSQIQPVTT